MEQILNKLSEIELTAQRIMEDCDRQKQQLSEEAEQKCKNYDRVRLCYRSSPADLRSGQGPYGGGAFWPSQS